MARGAIDVVAFLTASQHLHRDRKGHQVGFFAFDQAGVIEAVFAQLPASDGMRDLGANRAPVREEGCASLGNELGLVLHVLTTAGGGKGSQAYGQELRSRADSLGQINTPPPPPKPAGNFRGSCATPPARTWGRSLPDKGRIYPPSPRCENSAR